MERNGTLRFYCTFQIVEMEKDGQGDAVSAKAKTREIQDFNAVGMQPNNPSAIFHERRQKSCSKKERNGQKHTNSATLSFFINMHMCSAQTYGGRTGCKERGEGGERED